MIGCIIHDILNHMNDVLIKPTSQWLMITNVMRKDLILEMDAPCCSRIITIKVPPSYIPTGLYTNVDSHSWDMNREF